MGWGVKWGGEGACDASEHAGSSFLPLFAPFVDSRGGFISAFDLAGLAFTLQIALSLEHTCNPVQLCQSVYPLLQFLVRFYPPLVQFLLQTEARGAKSEERRAKSTAAAPQQVG